MKQLLLVFTASFLSFLALAQSNTNQPKGLLPPGTLTPANTSKPAAVKPTQPSNKAVQTTTTNTQSNSNFGSLLDGNSTTNTSTNTSVIYVPTEPQNLAPLTPLTGTTTSVTTQTIVTQQPLQPLTPLNSAYTNINSAVQNNTNNQPLAPLPTINYNTSTSNKLGGVITTAKIDPLLNYNYTGNNNQYQQPALAPLNTSIENKSIKTNIINNNSTPSNVIYYNSNANSVNMPPLAGLDGQYPSAYGNKPKQPETGMPELAPIEGTTNGNEDLKKVMPELVSIDDGNKRVPIGNDGSYILKSIGIPEGTTIEATLKRSILIKPNVIVKPQPVYNNQPIDKTNYYKPHAGGSSGIELLDDEPQQQYQNTNSQNKPVQQQSYYTQGTVNQISVQQTTTTTTTPCTHNHTSYCPCCVKAPVQKWKPKKTWKPKPQVKKEIVYVYIEAPQPQPQPQQQKVEERVVYVPQPAAQPVYKQPVTYKPEPEQKIVYTDYTKTMYKEPIQTQNCQCPAMPNTYQSVSEYNNSQRQPVNTPAPKTQNQQQSPQQNTSANTQNYQPTNQRYVSQTQGANAAGPTSGDYPIGDTYTTDDPLKYTFYVNQLGKYSVMIYNHNFKLFLQQNGQVTQYEILPADPNYKSNGKPKLNSFGYPTALASIPISYNYNRSINKIGNIKFDYDFEGFFKNVNGSSVFYNSRSGLSKVDNINVQYDARGYVTGVDSNDGLVEVAF